MIKINKSASIKPKRLPVSAWLGHIPFAAWLVEELQPTILVELGTHHGASYLGFCQAVSELALTTRCYAVDTWEGDEHATYYGDTVYEELRSYHDEHYDDFSKLLRCTFDSALEKFIDGSVDLLHIDGLHTYEAVKHDYESWLPKLSDRAVVLFHDLEERQGDFGVWRLWSELVAKYPSFSFTHSHGLGVLLVGQSVPESIVALAHLNTEHAAVVSNLFASLGRGVQAAYDREWWRKEAESYGVKLLESETKTANSQAEVVSLSQELAVERDLAKKREDKIKDLEDKYERTLSELPQAQQTLLAEQKVHVHGSILHDETARYDLQDTINQQEKRLIEDIKDRDELINSLAQDLHHARESLNTAEARLGKAVLKVCRRWTPEGSLIGRFLGGAIKRAIVHHDKRKGRPNAVKGESLKCPVGPAGTPTQAFPREFANYINSCEPSENELDVQREECADFAYMPVVSFIIPIYRLPREVLEHTLLSVEAQTYSNWEACLAWADTGDEEGWNWLTNRCIDKRYKLLKLKENGGISNNSNAALDNVSGEFIALLDHDDTITPWALFDMVKAMQEHPEADFLYSDKDSITENGECRLNALFKPAWSPEMLHSVNYLTHFNLMRTVLVRAVGGWDPQTDGAQDWDIFFKVTALAREVLRVPSIQYHWRILPTSTSTGLQTKPYAIMGQLRTQKMYFERKGLPATVKRTDNGMFHITWPLVVDSAHVFVLQNGTKEQLAVVLDLLLASRVSAIKRITVLHKGEPESILLPFLNVADGRVELIAQDQINWYKISEMLEPRASSIAILGGKAVGLSGGLIDELIGWTQYHPEIAWVGALAVEQEGKVLEAGRLVAEDGSTAPLFRGCYPHEYGCFGGPLWYRNIRAVSEYAVAFKSEAFRAGVNKLSLEERLSLESIKKICANSVNCTSARGLLNPFAVVYLQKENSSENWSNSGEKYWSDPYFNPAFNQVNPLGLK